MRDALTLNEIADDAAERILVTPIHPGDTLVTMRKDAIHKEIRVATARALLLVEKEIEAMA